MDVQNLSLVADKTSRTLSERISALVELVAHDAGATRVETATGYAFGIFRGAGKVDADNKLDQIVSRLLINIFMIGSMVYTALVLRLTPLIAGVEIPQLPLEYEAEFADNQPLILKRYFWQADWQNQSELEKILLDFARKANEIYILKCQEYQAEERRD